MKTLCRFQKSLIRVSSTLLLLYISIYIYFYPPPWISWEIENVTQINTINTRVYLNTKHWRCGDLRYENSTDCEFALCVQNSKSDTLFYAVMKHVTGKPRYGKTRDSILGQTNT
jgi:hypothetical protein